jgi:hypothetical protein
MKRQTPSSTPKVTSRKQLRLLLHAVDGCVPYLTPSSLEQQFPPSDDLWIGLSVRDTCVAPVFQEKKKGKKEKVKATIKSKEEANTKPRKPRGYTFSPVNPDPWLLPYTRITVPSFDFANDKQVAHSCTNTHVAVWTPHGRQKLTPDLYAEASMSLNSQCTLSLYDIHDEDGNSKRKAKAEQRNKEWFQDLFNKHSESPNTEGTLWAPILLPTSHDSSVTFNFAHSSSDQISGVALIGTWRHELEDAVQKLEAQEVAILSTNALSEILDVASGSKINIIGTDLPTRWAKKKHALAVDIAMNENAKRTKSGGEKNRLLNNDGCMDLSNKVYARDARPLVEGCSCMACANGSFSRSYIHHLVVAEELLAEILLFGHNLHHMLVLIRSFSAAEDPEGLKEFIAKQLSLA